MLISQFAERDRIRNSHYVTYAGEKIDPAKIGLMSVTTKFYTAAFPCPKCGRVDQRAERCSVCRILQCLYCSCRCDRGKEVATVTVVTHLREQKIKNTTA